MPRYSRRFRGGDGEEPSWLDNFKNSLTEKMGSLAQKASSLKEDATNKISGFRQNVTPGDNSVQSNPQSNEVTEQAGGRKYKTRRGKRSKYSKKSRVRQRR